MSMVRVVGCHKRSNAHYFEHLPVELWHIILSYEVQNFTHLLTISTLSKKWRNVVAESSLWFSCDLTLHMRPCHGGLITFTTRGREKSKIPIFSRIDTFDRCRTITIQRLEALPTSDANQIHANHTNPISSTSVSQASSTHYTRANIEEISQLKDYLVAQKFRFYRLWEINHYFYLHTDKTLKFIERIENNITHYWKNIYIAITSLLLLGSFLFPHSLQMIIILIYGYYLLFYSCKELCRIAKNHLYWFGSFFHVFYHLFLLSLLGRYFIPLFYKPILIFLQHHLHLLLSSSIFSKPAVTGLLTLFVKAPTITQFVPQWSTLCFAIAAYYHNFSILHMSIVFLINSSMFRSIFLIPFIIQKIMNAYLIYPFTIYINQEFDDHSESSSHFYSSLYSPTFNSSVIMNDATPSSASSTALLSHASFANHSSNILIFHDIVLRFVLPIIHWYKMFQIFQILTIFYASYTKFRIAPWEILKRPTYVISILWTWMKSLLDQRTSLHLGGLLLLTIMILTYTAGSVLSNDSGEMAVPVFNITKKIVFVFLIVELLQMMTLEGIHHIVKERIYEKIRTEVILTEEAEGETEEEDHDHDEGEGEEEEGEDQVNEVYRRHDIAEIDRRLGRYDVNWMNVVLFGGLM